MPELPEAQMVCDAIWPLMHGKRIVDLLITDEGVLGNCDYKSALACIKDETFEAVSRRGKYIVFELNTGVRMVVHLRMTGRLLAVPAEYPQEKHTRAVFRLENGEELRFIDQRKFGRIWIYEHGQEMDCGIASLGPEPFDAKLDAVYLRNVLGRTTRAVKTCLMDQSLIAGIGNIYSDEILHSAGIAPDVPGNQLTVEVIERLAQMIPETMRFFVDKNQMSAEEYLRTGGREYRNTPYFRVYGRAGKACMGCGEALRKTVIGGRSSVHCPFCQPLDEKE